MKTIEIRRHACTKKGEARGHGSHLSGEGVRLAGDIGLRIPQPDYVITSTIPRTLETALAMGLAVDACVKVHSRLSGRAMDVVGHLERWQWEEPWLRFRELSQAHDDVAEFGAWMRQFWEAALSQVPENGHVLAISHGREIELGVIACLPEFTDTDLAALGAPLHQCEGVTMSWDGTDFRLVDLHRERRCQPGRG